ncbi:MAG: hypothetical protein JWQ81_5754 [Amycolatopsis sp.]|jgi:uncharacterized protein (TIGR03085 family)|uniref:TIGR03085 family metal-binding protein n=1 Tax=Amycolatopsis sp. TaxID=37632 RepID=UPI00262E8D90|nr:TIGR03085 family metal-binding protein [Amycolatopsis sp.]MCU1685015.1 hypothetical protein [Amycolatopsis sp.]
MSVAKDERTALADLFTELGPDAATLCEGWTTRDLAAHLIIREHRADASPGIMIPAFAGHTQRVQDSYAARPYDELVKLFRAGPSKFWPTSIGKLDELTNTAEFLVHHEDVRRAQPDWKPRPAEPVRDAATWKNVKQSAKLNFRKTPVGVTLRTPDGREAVAKAGENPVTVTGEPMDLLMYAFGRAAGANVTFDGPESAVEALQGVKRGM